MMTKDDTDQAKVIEYFLSRTMEDGGKDEVSACMARLSATSILSTFGEFMNAEMNRPNQLPGHTIAAIASFHGMMMAYAMSLSDGPKSADNLEELVDAVTGMTKASCLLFVRTALKMEEENG